MTNTPDVFTATIEGLNLGLQVRHVAEFSLLTCSPTDDVPSVWAAPGVAAFDQIPVRGRHGRIVGVLERRAGIESGIVDDRMRPLDDSILIGDRSPLYSFVELAKETHYRLVLTDKGVTGIVTGSDLLKLPARLLAFAFVTHLEATMATLIRTRYQSYDTDWLLLLSAGRREKLERKCEDLQRQRLDPEPLELADFCDKRDIANRTFKLGGNFVQDVQEIEKLRNALAHSGRFVSDDFAELHSFVNKIEAAHRWIVILDQIIRAESTK